MDRRPQGRDRDPRTGQPDTQLSDIAGGAYASDTAGGFAGRVDPAHEDQYWRHEFPTRSYAVSSPYGWDDYGPAYRLGYERCRACQGRRFDDVAPKLAREWEQSRGGSRLAWDDARHAVRDAYERIAASIERALPGDTDRDGL